MARRSGQGPASPTKRKECYFTKNKITYIDYKDVELLQRFLSERGKIRSARVTGTRPRSGRPTWTGSGAECADSRCRLHAV